ncbi:HNH endonuclease signature motif containing protein [Microbacterium yannicii]|uniref:HNH endonuclease signature motif containing protein n=1 Tax=Microbacterium yannicii TaxID=671622 RepID=UPI0002EFD791|nr:HNH endonuclease signature motif containing protein [Microbacterium yannicii]
MFIDPELPDQEFPDEVDRVLEVAGMITVFAAERLVRIDQMRREALAEATRNGRVLTDVVERGVRLELASALRVTEHAAGGLLAFAEAMVHSFPPVLRSMERASITEDHARVLVTALSEIEPGFHATVLAKGLELAEREPVGTFRRKLRTLIDTARSATLRERYEDAVTKRRSVIEAADDGMGWLHVYGPIVAIHAVHARATGMAKAIRAADVPDAGAAPDRRTLEQVRTDVILDLLVDGRTDLHPEAARGITATVTVTVPALALLHDTDESRAAAAIEPPVIEGMVPIPLTVAKELAGSATGWTRVLTHPETGMVLSVGRDRYRPPPALAKLARWRADRCMGPGCGMPASRCEVDHNIDWARLGHTALDNLAPLCKGHHIVRHHTDWTIEQVAESGGAIRWTSPTGRQYLVEPERRVPVFRATSSNGTGDAPF